MGVLSACTPRPEVLKGDLDDAIFAADFGDLMAGKAPKVYGDARTFFDNTHPAAQLCEVSRAVCGRLADPRQEGAVVRLSTGFGGGKTHTLMALWHLANNVADLSLGIEILPAAGRPKKPIVAAIDASKAGVPEFTRHGKTKIRSLWGEIFWQLGKEEALKSLGAADDPEASPNERQIEDVLPKGKSPLLILMDEIVIYMAKLSDRGQGNLLGFMSALASVVVKRPQTVLVVTDPADQRVYAKESAQVDAKLSAAAVRLDDLIGRKASDFDPIGKESAQVIVRRLFALVDKTAAEKASALYHGLYKRVLQDKPGLLPQSAASSSYAGRIVSCFPFHPRLIDTAQDRLRALQNFHLSRGVLRLFARIIRGVWEAQNDLDLVTAGEIDWSSSRIQADLLQRINRESFRPAITADIEKHALELDGNTPCGVHQRVAGALLLESLPLEANSGMDLAEIALATLRPEEAGHEPSEALERLFGVSWHIYPMPSGRGYQFRYEPNVNKQIEERMARVPLEDAESRVFAETQNYFSGPGFKPAPWPQNARQVPNLPDLQLVLCADESMARHVLAVEDDADPKALMPRQFINSILAVTATPAALQNAIERARRIMAARQIEEDNRGESGKMVREQLKRLLPDLEKQFRLQTCRAFDRIVLPGGSAYPIEERFQVSDEDVLSHPSGQKCLRRFLEEKGLVYQASDALDVERFLEEVLPGATAAEPGVWTAKAVHERFLRAQGMRLIPGQDVVRNTILRAMEAGRLVVRFDDGRAWDARSRVEGPEGKRRRVPDRLPGFALSENVRIARADSKAGMEWVKTDAEPGSAGPGSGDGAASGAVVTAPPLGRVQALNWEKVLEFAIDRPLLRLRLCAKTPAAAQTLMALAQPLGADALSLSVTASGQAKDGGNLSFRAGDVRPTHPTKPLSISQTIFNALSENPTYEADLNLSFGASGRLGLESQLAELAGQAGTAVSPLAEFDKPQGAAP